MGFWKLSLLYVQLSHQSQLLWFCKGSHVSHYQFADLLRILCQQELEFGSQLTVQSPTG